MNMFLHGVLPENQHLRNGDTLDADWPTDEETEFDVVTMNPPYSAKWSAAEGFKQDERFMDYGGKLAPKSKADYAFLLHGFYHLKQTGTMAIVLPHGVLFRGAAEGTIRQTLLEKNGVINSILNFLHLPEQSIINTPSAIVLGMVYNFLPFMVLPIYNVLSKIDKDVIHAARDLGANTAQTFFKIIMPLSIPGIISGITMVFVPSLTTFVISDLLGGSKILLIGNVIEQEFKQGSNWNVGSGLSLVLMLFIIASMALIAKYDKNGEGNTF